MSNFKPSHGIAFDIDGIVLDTATPIWDVVTTHMKTPWSINQWKSYDLEDIFGVPTKNLRHLYDPILYQHDLPMLRGAAETLQWLHAQYPEEELLFITSRRPEHIEPAIKSIRKGLGPRVPFKVVSTENKAGEKEFTNSKLSLLEEHGILYYLEDNPMYWDEYRHAGVKVMTFRLPWTEDPAERYTGSEAHIKESDWTISSDCVFRGAFQIFQDWAAFLLYLQECTNLSWERRHKRGEEWQKKYIR